MSSTLEGCKSLGGRYLGEYKSLGGQGSGSRRGKLDMGLGWGSSLGWGRGLRWCKSLGVRGDSSIGACIWQGTGTREGARYCKILGRYRSLEGCKAL